MVNEQIHVDVLIIGGGAQGLWLLNHLNDRGYAVILLENGELGGGQTCHSHGLIHRGHYYDDVDMLILLNAAAQFWEALTKKAGLQKINARPAIVGFGPGIEAESHKILWERGGLSFRELVKRGFPHILRHGLVKRAFSTAEFSLNAEEIVNALASDYGHLIYLIDGMDQNIIIHKKGRRVSRVDAMIAGRKILLRPKLLILAAGEGNLTLLNSLEVGQTPNGVPVQARRKNHMLLVRGRNLPELTAVFPPSGGLRGLFICSRPLGNRQRLWLVSDHKSTDFDREDNQDPSVNAYWIRSIMNSLRGLAPDVLNMPLSYAVYTALTAERNLGTSQHMSDFFVESFAFENMLAVWPTKLTLTPLASKVVVTIVQMLLPERSGKLPPLGHPDIPDQRPRIAAEMWTKDPFETPTVVKTQWMSRQDFKEKYGLN